MLLYQFQHSFQVLEYVPILQSKHRETSRIQKLLTSFIASERGLTIMRGSIQFDGEPFAWTIEINDVGSNAVLSPEFSTVELRSLQQTPQRCLSRRQARAQRPAPLCERAAVVNPWRA